MLSMLKLPPITQILAANLRDAIDRAGKYTTLKQLADAAGVSATSIGYMLKPDTRAPSKSGRAPAPTLTQIEAVAKALGVQTWQLIYPNPELLPRQEAEIMLWDAMEESMRQMRQYQEQHGGSEARCHRHATTKRHAD